MRDLKCQPSQHDYSVSILNNGDVSIFDRASGLRGHYTNTGAHISGDLYLAPMRVVELIRKGV